MGHIFYQPKETQATMRVTVYQENLQKGLSIVSRAISSRPTLPILSNVIISTEGQRLKLAATSLDFGITCWIGANISEPGAVTVPGKLFSELVNYLSQDRVELELNPRTLTLNIRCGSNTGNVKGIDAAEFPIIPQADAEKGVAIPAALFKDMVRQVEFAAAKDDNRPVLTGILLRFQGDTLTMASADGYRLAVRTAKLDVKVDAPQDLIVPARFLNEVARIISDEDEEVLISVPEGRNQAMFHLRNVDIFATLVEGNFPNYETIIPRNPSTITQVYTDELLKACKRSAVFARDVANAAKIIINKGENGLGRVLVTSKSQEKGDNQAVVDASVEGNDLEITFNIGFLQDILGVIDETQLIIETGGSSLPGLFRPVGRDDFIHVIMPMANK
jgi:DNA polymerase-3 subunit beta